MTTRDLPLGSTRTMRPVPGVGAFVVGAALLIEVIVALATKADGGLSDSHDLSRSFGSPAEIGRLFLTDHLLAFEITSIILLIAAVGGVVLGMKESAEEEAL